LPLELGFSRRQQQVAAVLVDSAAVGLEEPVDLAVAVEVDWVLDLLVGLEPDLSVPVEVPPQSVPLSLILL